MSAAETLLTTALARVESASIRAWAVTAENRPIWLKIAAKAVENQKHDASSFAAYIVCVAIGA